MLPNQPIYVMRRQGKRNFSKCGKCGFPITPGKKYTVDPVDSTIIYHAECYKQKYRNNWGS